ncbi:MAG: hypothetical protein AB1648_10615 [Pseudomonadota bacterium]|jgi:hypothetical protein
MTVDEAIKVVNEYLKTGSAIGIDLAATVLACEVEHLRAENDRLNEVLRETYSSDEDA